MSSPRRRRPPSTSTINTATRGSIRTTEVLSSAPRTRASARLATTNKLKVYDENAATGFEGTPGLKTPAVGGQGRILTRSLRSRGPLKENRMNVQEERLQLIGKRKAVGDGDQGKEVKAIKMDHAQTMPFKASVSQKPIVAGSRPAGPKDPIHQPSSETLRSLLSSRPSTFAVPSTPLASRHHHHQFSAASTIPTPARELLRKDPESATDPDLPLAPVVARPPTPPRMKPRTPAMMSAQGSMTPIRATPSTGVKMPASLRKPAASAHPPTPARTPGRLTMPASLKSPPTMLTPVTVVAGSRPVPLSAPMDLFNDSQLRTDALTPSASLSHMARGTMSPTRSVAAPAEISTGPPASPLRRHAEPSPRVHKVIQPTLERFFRPAPQMIHLETDPFNENEKKADYIMEDSLSISSGATTEKEVECDAGSEDTGNVTATDDVVMLDAETTTDVSDPNAISDEPHKPVVHQSSELSAHPAEEVLTPESAATEDPTRKTVVAVGPIQQPLARPIDTGAMPPPSRIPRSHAMPTISSATKITDKASSTVQKKPSMRSLDAGLGSLPERRPSTRPMLVPASASEASTSDGLALTGLTTGTSVSPVKRKPSYPSSLGSGPLANPTPRVVSNPMTQPRSVSDSLSSSASGEAASAVSPQPRSVSAPAPVPMVTKRPRISFSSSKREGLTGETSKSLAGLSEALGKLKARRSEQNVEENVGPSRPDDGPETHPVQAPQLSVIEPEIDEGPDDRPASSGTFESSSRLSSAAGHRPRSSIHPGDVSTSSEEDGGVADQSMAALLCSTNGMGCLRGVRAFVDVRTSDGESSGKVFVEMLKGLGARVFTRPTERCTHIVYKSGRQATLDWWRRQEKEQQPLVVGVKWVMDCKKNGKKVEEAKYVVDVSAEEVFQKRRKSMEPKSFAASQGLTVPVNPSRQALLEIAKARRNSMKYAPKISSPLKRAHMCANEE
ncbi:hypothetical protein IAU60_000334 [Kwoniella sp. DSM 27419]